MPRRNGRPSRWKPRAYKRYRAARNIQRAWRRRKGGRRTKTTNFRVGRPRGAGSLRSRVKKLEGSTKKHYDYVFQIAAGQPLNEDGSNTFAPTNESFSQILAIQPYNGDGTVPPLSGAARGTEANCREGHDVWCSKVRLRGLVQGIRLQDPRLTRDCVDVVPPLNIEVTPFHLNEVLRQACQSRVHITILQDKFPATLDPTTGFFEPNPLPVNPQNPLQSIYQAYQLTTQNTLMTLGPDAALRNYTSNRFKVVHHEVMQFSADHTRKWFDITLNVNKKLQFRPRTSPTGPQGNTDPVNYNLLCYFSTVPNETALIGDPGYQLPNGAGVQTPLLRQPNLSQLSSRTYFTEA